MIRYLVLLLVVFAPFAGRAQYKYHTLSGIVHIKDSDEGDYKYKVVFTTVGRAVVGYSGTWLPFINELRTGIGGQIDTATHTITFKESEIEHAPITNACYFDMRLTWHEVNGKVVFSGTFIGHNKQGQLCDSGTAVLELQADNDPVFAPKKPAAKEATVKNPQPKTPKTASAKAEPLPLPKKDSVRPAPVEREVIRVSATGIREFDWHSDSCVLELWDGEYVDDDIITVLLNGEHVLDDYSLVTAKKRVVLHIRPGNNKLCVIAQNEGKAPPNTAMISLTDGNINYNILSTLHTGDTATITVKGPVRKRKK